MTTATRWVPMIDVSQHQGSIDFSTMLARGVPNLLMRASHGSTQDKRIAEYYPDAIAAGYDPKNVGFYSFINPKRGSAEQTARDTAAIIQRIAGRTNVLYMLDVENYRDEPPNKGTQPISGQKFSRYLRDHEAAFRAAMPGCSIIYYSNSAYWDSPDGPQDSILAAEVDWMVPRYPCYSSGCYDRNPVPGPEAWPGYAFGLQSAGPVEPRGSTWDGWQFSAGFNRQGSVYGCESADLDLNIVSAEAWERWTAAAPAPDPDPDPDPPFVPNPLGPRADVFEFLEDGEPRLLDTRHDGTKLPLRAGEIVEIPVGPDAVGCEVTLTAVSVGSGGHAIVWPGGPRPRKSNLNWSDRPGAVANTTKARLNGEGCFYVYVNRPVHLVVDLEGFWRAT